MNKRGKRQQRKKRIRAKILGTSKRPRLSVFRSNREIYAQLIDDEKGRTLVSLSGSRISEKELAKKTKGEIAGLIGEKLAVLAKKAKITQVVFDRAGYKYHGRIKALAEGARKGGLKF